LAIKKERIREHLVKPDDAAGHAASHLHIGVFTSTPGMTSWRGANLGEFTTIYDLNNEPLFYDFPVLSLQREQVGMVRASASRVLGVPVLAIYLGGPRWHTEKATLWAHEYIENKRKGKIIDSKPVCYAYPKLGIKVNWKNRRGQTKRTVIEVGDYSVVSEGLKTEEQATGMFSFYGNISGNLVPNALKKFALYDKLVEELQAMASLNLADSLDLKGFLKVQTSLVAMIPWFTSKTLTFCGHGYSHECFHLHPQPQKGYCAPATGRMILDFWRYYYSLNKIANEMGTSKIPGLNLYVTTLPGEVQGLESLTCDDFSAMIEEHPSFAKVKSEINANRPFDYSYADHSTACAGYSEAKIVILGKMPQKSVYLYDPWPANTGAIRWEPYDTTSPDWGKLKRFVYLKRVWVAP